MAYLGGFCLSFILDYFNSRNALFYIPFNTNIYNLLFVNHDIIIATIMNIFLFNQYVCQIHSIVSAASSTHDFLLQMVIYCIHLQKGYHIQQGKSSVYKCKYSQKWYLTHTLPQKLANNRGMNHSIILT